MALIDVVSMELSSQQLAAKFPSTNLRYGTQLVVHPGQVAFFVRGGAVCDSFTAGTYTLESNNLPILHRLINIPFGGHTPFQAEVWFMNTTALLGSKWGTTTPLQVEDPKYDVIVPLRAYGMYGFVIADQRLFLEKMLGNQEFMVVGQINNYFKGRILSQLTRNITNKLTRDNISILQINSYLDDVSEYCREQINVTFAKYGLSLTELDIINISPDDNDPSYKRLKEAKDLAARVKIAGKDVYQMERSFGVLDKAAENEGAGGMFMQAGVGMGAGIGMGQQMGQVMGQMNIGNQMPPQIPQQAQYYLAINGQQQGPFSALQIQQYLQSGAVTPTTLCWKAGMAQWAPLNTFIEFMSVPPCPPTPMPTPPTL